MDETDTSKQILVLLNDTDPLLNRVTKNKLLKELGWECEIALSYDDALKSFKDNRPDAVITELLIMDYKNRDGINLISEIRAIETKDTNNKKVPIIVFSENDEEQFFQSAIKSGANACYSKNDLSLNDLIHNLQTHIS